MKTKTINLYTIDELKIVNEKGYQKAIESFRNDNEYYFLSESMEEYLIELLQESKVIKYDGVSDLKVYYSLSYCQGDGAMFTGLITYNYKGKDYLIKIKQSGRYYHSNSKDYSTTDTEGEEVDEWQEVEESFDTEYKSICEKLEQWGYDYIESEDSEENIVDTIKANEYTFTSNGTIEHE